MSSHDASLTDEQSVEIAPLPRTNDLMTRIGYFYYQQSVDPDGQDSERVNRDIDRYVDHFRLVVDGRGPGFVDVDDAWNPFPAGVVRVAWRELEIVHQWLGGASHDRSQILIFCDEAGTALLRLPAYGWEIRDLDRFVAAAGWDQDMAGKTMKVTVTDTRAIDEEFPGLLESPVWWITGHREPESLRMRLRRRLSRDRR